jgi:hypothetical protein
MGSLESGVGQAFAVKLRSIEPTSVEPLLGYTGRAKVEGFGRIYPNQYEATKIPFFALR